MTIHFTTHRGARSEKLALIATLERMSWVENKGLDEICQHFGWTKKKASKMLSDYGIAGHTKPYKAPKFDNWCFVDDNMETGRL